MLRVLVVADAPLVRTGLESILAREADIVLVGGEGGRASTVAQQLEAEEPDVILIELGPDEGDQLILAPALLGALPDGVRPAVVALVEAPTVPSVAGALRAGARAVVSRSASGEEIVAAVRAAAAGLAALPVALIEGLIVGQRESVPTPSADGELTPREVEVLRLMAEGLVNKQIAARLGISDHTVKFHVGSIFQKLRASTRTEAVTIGLRRGMLLI